MVRSLAPRPHKSLTPSGKQARLPNRRSALASVLAFGVLAPLMPGQAAAQGVHGFRRKIEKRRKNKPTGPSRGILEGILPSGRSGSAEGPAEVSRSPRLLAAAKRAVESGISARSYCIQQIEAGNTELQPAYDLIQAMLPVANALAKLSEVNAARLKQVAQVSIDFLQDCDTVCRINGDLHPLLGDCSDACTVAINECQRAVAA